MSLAVRYCPSLSSKVCCTVKTRDYYSSCAECNSFALGVQAFPRTSRQNWHYTWRKDCTGFNFRMVFVNKCDLLQGGSQSPGWLGQGDSHWLIMRLPLRWRQLASVLTHFHMQSPSQGPWKHISHISFFLQGLQWCRFRVLTLFCSSTSVYSNTMQFLWLHW